MTLVFALQGALIAAVAALAFERIRVLWYRAPVATPFLAALEEHCRTGKLAEAGALCARLPRSAAALVAGAGLSGGAEGVAAMEEAMHEVRANCVVRLRAIRACATLASTFGLLGAIVALVRGFGGDGLLGLEAGLAERMALEKALRIMSIGVATSAVCFSLFSMLRRSALDVLSQAARAARAVEAVLP